MHSYLFGPLCLFSAYAVYFLAASFLASRRHARNATRLGCKPPKRRPHQLPLGLDLAHRVVKADREKCVPEMFFDVYEELGCPSTWIQQFLGSETLVTVDPKNIQAILATQFNDFELGETRRGTFSPVLGNGIFTADGRAWEHSRALLRPQFARDQVSDLELEEIHVQNLLRRLPAEASGWTAKVDLQPLFFNLTLDSATEFLFGETVNSQLVGSSDQISLPTKEDRNGKKLDWSTFGRDWDHATMAVGMRARLGELYWIYSPRSYHQSSKRIHKFADYYVNLALTTDLSSLKEKDTSGSPKRDKYIFLQELATQTRDPTELRSQLLNILLAGRDTTAGLLGWTFFTLVRHPDIYAKLRAIILDRFGTYSQPHSITFANLKSCTYLQHVLNEILRLYPNVPLNSRRAVRDTTLPRGGGPDGASPIYIPKDMEVNYAVYIMHRRKNIWGDDVEDFKPDRWEGRKMGWEYLPFNGGPRVCLGQQFALTEAGYVIVRLVQRFEKMENMDQRKEIRQMLSVTTSTDGCWVKLKEARE